MKKFIKKHLSIVLSLAIILGAILPVFSGVMGVSALTDEENAIANLKAEWEALASFHNPDINPNRWWNPSGTAGGTNMAASTAFTESLPEGVDLGAYYTVLTGLGDTADISSRQCVLYEFCKDGNGAGIIPYARSLVNINEMDDIYFWVKIDNATKDVTFKIQVMTNTGSAKTYNLSPYVIPASKSGQWVKLSLKEIGGENWYGSLNQELYRVMMAPANASGATITMGAGKIVVPGTCPLPENTSEWGADEWLNAAKTVDRSLYIDVTAFENAVEALKAFSSVDPNVEVLAEEWAKLEYIPTPVYEGFRVFYFKNSSGVAYKNTNTGATQLIYDTNTDNTYGLYQFTGRGIVNSPYSVIGYNIDGDTPSAYTLTQLTDMYFWYKATGNVALRIELSGFNGSDKYNYIAAQNDVALTGDNGWHKLSIMDAFSANWDAILTSKGTYNLTRVTINVAAAQGVTCDATFGGLYFELEDTSLVGSENWTNEQWVDNARALDLSNYNNTAAFEAALLAALESVYGITEKDIAAKELISAWGQMTETDAHNILPNRWWNQSGTFGYTDKASASSYTGVLPAGVQLGSKVFAVEGLGAQGALGSKQCILYEFLDGADKAYGSADKTPYSILDIEDIYFWVKLDNLTTDATLTVQLATNDSGAKYTTLPAYTVPASKSGEWVKVSVKEIGGDAWRGALNETLYRFQLSISNASGATFTTGSAFIEKGAGVPEGVADMKPTELLAAAMALDLSLYDNTEAFAEKLDALKLLCEEEVAIASLKEAANNLSLVSAEYLYARRYFAPDGTLSEADTYAISTDSYAGDLPEGADDTNVKSYLGGKVGTITGLTDMGAAYKTSGNKQTVLYEFEGGGSIRSTFTTSQIKDMYFWYKLEGTARAKIINGIYVIGANDNAVPTKLGSEITLIGDGKWHKVSFNEVYGAGWIANHGLYDGKVYRMLMSIGEAEGGKVTLGGVVPIVSVGLLPEGEADWTLSDWIYTLSKLNYEKYLGAEDFKAALENAIAVRDRLQISRGSNLTTYDDFASADADLAGISSQNALEGIIPTVYHSADGLTRSEASNENTAGLTDGDNTTIGSVTGLDNTNEASFTDFVYQFAGSAKITDFFIYNDSANIADKYYIYMADSQSDLFLQGNLLAPFVNNEGKLVQRFNFNGKPDVSGMYLGIRVFGDSDTVSFSEIVAKGDVVVYDLEKGKFSNDRIAAIGDNILVGKEPKIKAGLKFDWSSFMSKQYTYEAFVDNNSNTGAAVYGNYMIKEKDDTISIHFYYDLGTTYTIDKLFINHWDNKGLETGKYEIYAAGDINSLFMTRNMLVSYDNTAEGPNGTTLSQLFTLKKEVVARYISFHITYPISDFDYCETQANYNKLYGIRISELGVYGEKWVKPYALVNLTSHVPMDVFRTDANGVTTEVGDDEYNGIEHKNTCDGNDATFADIKIKNGETLNFVYNLAAEMTLEEICMKLRLGSVKRMNIYASTVEDAIWENSSLIYSETDGFGETYFGKGFATSPIKARYIRFEILENDGEDLIIDEMSAIGGNDQEFTYMNLVEEKPETVSFYLQDKKTGDFSASTEQGNKWLPSWTGWNQQYPFSKAFDNDYDSVYDIFVGKNGEESLSFIIDFGTLNAIDSISLVGGSYDAYWPDELNFYFGESDVALMEKDAKPAKAWEQTVEDGIFTYEFVPQVAQYVRIEIVRAENEVYSQYSDRIVAVIGEIMVSGLELRSRAVNGVAATVVDEATGIKAEILALSENDVFDKIQSMMVVKRAATAEESAYAKKQGLDVATQIYEIYFLDVNGDIVTDTGGREVAIYLPESLYSGDEDIFVLQSEFGGLTMIEFQNAEGFYKFIVDDISSALSFALGYMVEDEILPDETTDTNDDVYGEDDTDEDETEETEDEEEESSKKKRKKVKVVRKGGSELTDYLWIIIVVVAVVVVAAGVTLFIILAKKKKQQESEN